MIDPGLLVSIALVVGTATILTRLMPPRTMGPRDLFDVTGIGIIAGIVAGRVVAMSFDSPAGLTHLGELMLLRSGMDFWSGVVAGVVTLAVSARRAGVAVVPRLADCAPFALCAYAVYEATCLARDGCFGPRSPLGLRPAGMGSRQFPVGLAVAVAVIVVAVGVRRLAASSPGRALLLATAGLAGIRYSAAFWLPRISSGPTRQQSEALIVLILAGVGALAAATPYGGRWRRLGARLGSPGR